MLRLIVSGVSGRMGRAICGLVAQSSGAKIVAGVDSGQQNNQPFPVYKSFDAINEKADCIIDFSNPDLLASLLEYAVKTKTPAVIATTGFQEKQREAIGVAAKEVPIFYSANMSVGVNLVAALCKQANAVLGQSFDIEIVEKHHNRKLDSPSGTAILLADSINSAEGKEYNYVFDRSKTRQARQKNEIGIHSVRGGNVIGEHDVHFFGEAETITISHNALSREVFADGALRAANFLADKPKGLYSMSDLVKLG